MKKVTLTAIGSLMVLIALYLFPFGQDIVVLTMTKLLGSQMLAWTYLYFICFGLLFFGYVLGGHKVLMSSVKGIFKVFPKNPYIVIALLIITFIIFNSIGRLLQ